MSSHWLHVAGRPSAHRRYQAPDSAIVEDPLLSLKPECAFIAHPKSSHADHAKA